jgi:hypothetical protein
MALPGRKGGRDRRMTNVRVSIGALTALVVIVVWGSADAGGVQKGGAGDARRGKVPGNA